MQSKAWVIEIWLAPFLLLWKKVMNMNKKFLKAASTSLIQQRIYRDQVNSSTIQRTVKRLFFEKNRIYTLYINVKTKQKAMKTYSLKNDINIAQNILRKNIQYNEYDCKIRNSIDNNIKRMYCVVIKKTITQTIS